VISIFQITYVVAPIASSPATTILSLMASPLAIIFWIDSDARHKRLVPCCDFGLFMYMFFPASLLWYAIWSRGAWGLLTATGVFGLMLLPYFLAGLVWVLLYGVG
jgi:hypothetical protein